MDAGKTRSKERPLVDEVKSVSFHQIGNRSIEAAAASADSLERREPVLPACDARIGGQSVLEKMQLAPGSEHTMHFLQNRAGSDTLHSVSKDTAASKRPFPRGRDSASPSTSRMRSGVDGSCLRARLNMPGFGSIATRASTTRV